MMIDAHIAQCEQCTEAMTLLRAAEERLSQSLASASTVRHSPESLAHYSYERVRRERLLRWTIRPVVVALFLLASALLVARFGATVTRLFTPPPAVETETFSLQCLSGEQAASLLKPYLPSPENPLWQAERFDVRPAGGGIRAVTMRAPRATLALVPDLLARFERDPEAACRR